MTLSNGIHDLLHASCEAEWKFNKTVWSDEIKYNFVCLNNVWASERRIAQIIVSLFVISSAEKRRLARSWRRIECVCPNARSSNFFCVHIKIHRGDSRGNPRKREWAAIITHDSFELSLNAVATSKCVCTAESSNAKSRVREKEFKSALTGCTWKIENFTSCSSSALLAPQPQLANENPFRIPTSNWGWPLMRS